METPIQIRTTNWLHLAIDWVHHTLLVIGLVASIAFVRVNFFGSSISLNFPEYRDTGQNIMTDEIPKKHR